MIDVGGRPAHRVLIALVADSMLRKAGWEPTSTATTADATIWRYRKEQHLGSLVLENQPQQCGRRFRVEVAEPL